MSKATDAAESQPSPPGNVILRRKVWDRLHREDKNFMGIVCGDTGSGKSEFGLRFCELIDPDFNEDKIAFTIQEFLRLVNEDHPPGSMILFDEVGVALDSSTHYDKDQIQLNHILETWREQNRGLVMTAPHIRLVQKKSRGLLHAQMDMQAIDRERFIGHARYRNIQQNTDTGDLYKKYPRLRDPETGKLHIYDTLSLFKPTPDIVEPYTERKRAFNDKLNQDVYDSVSPDDDEDVGLEPQDLADRIIEDGEVEDYIGIHNGNGTQYIDVDLIALDYSHLSERDCKRVKKAIEREVTL